MTGIGLALQTKDELEALAKEYVTRGELSENDGRKFVDDLMQRYDEAKEKLEEKIEILVKSILDKADIVTKSELEALKNEIAELKARLEQNDTPDDSPADKTE